MSSREKKRLTKSIEIVARLSSRSKLSDTNAFILQQRMRYILTLLGASIPSKTMMVDGIKIIKDIWPFKIYRLRKLINGRRPQQ